MEEYIALLEQFPQQKIKPPTNTIGHIFRHDYKENFISDWLAFLINPEFTGSTQPLAALLKLALSGEPNEIADVSIVREHTFEDQRRIDFFIETSNYVIGIENKIKSDLQPNQLVDYEMQMSCNVPLDGRELVLILLCPKSNKFCTDPNLDLGQFRLITYEDLVAEFRTVRFNLFENLRATMLMEDFIVHMEEYIMQNPGIAEDNLKMWRFEAEHRKELKSLLSSIEDSKKQFGNYIAERLSAITELRSDRDAWAPPSIHATYFQLYKSNWENAQVHFELLTKGDFPPAKLQIVLHTHERKYTGKTDELYNLQAVVTDYLKKKYGQDVFFINYESFEQSMEEIFAAVKDVVDRYTNEIDAGIIQ